MKPLEIKGARTRLGLSQKYMAEQLNINEQSYGKKERGTVRFEDFIASELKKKEALGDA